VVRTSRALNDHEGITIDSPRLEAALKQLLGNPGFGSVWLVTRDGETIGYAIVTYGFDLEFGGREGWLTEGSSSTVFVVKGDRLMTPPNDPRILPGTTREAVLELARAVAQEIRPVPAQELATADEVWIASAGRGVLPVTRLDGRAVGSGRPGPHWQRTYAELQAHLDAIASRPAL